MESIIWFCENTTHSTQFLSNLTKYTVWPFWYGCFASVACDGSIWFVWFVSLPPRSFALNIIVHDLFFVARYYSFKKWIVFIAFEQWFANGDDWLNFFSQIVRYSNIVPKYVTKRMQVVHNGLLWYVDNPCDISYRVMLGFQSTLWFGHHHLPPTSYLRALTIFTHQHDVQTSLGTHAFTAFSPYTAHIFFFLVCVAFFLLWK